MKYKPKVYKIGGRSLPSRYWGPFKQEWYSLCSGCSTYDGGGPDSKCPRCASGMWIGVVHHKISQFFYCHFYSVWYWWQNERPGFHNSRTRKFLRKHFPNLR
jgi:hypothetical protein